MKLENFNNKQQTTLEGLWENGKFYSSTAISLAPLKKFKGYCRVYMFRNHSHKKGDRRPNFLFRIVSADYAEKAALLEFEDVLYEAEDESITASWEYTEWNDYYMTTIYEGYRCSNCGERVGADYDTISKFKYCPFCGIEMR